MNKTLVGIATFGNLIFTKECVKSIKETTSYPVDFFIVVGKPGDIETLDWVNQENIPHKVHTKNMGFPYSINDIYDYTWKENNYDYLILAGNDTIAYPNCVNLLIEFADKSRYNCLSAVQYDVKMLVSDYPETKQYFSGNDYIINDFAQEPWKKFTKYNEPLSIGSMQLSDIQNFCLYKKTIFDVVGYTDVNFYPTYFVDNDYARRIVNSGLLCCTLAHARFFHFWSRTIKQETGGSTNKNFENSESYYIRKWGGKFKEETILAPTLINSREGEELTISYWRNQH